MNITKQLYQLQEVDLQVEANERAMSQIISQLGESQAVLRTQTRLNSECQHLEELKHQQHSTEWEIDDLVSKLAVAEKKLYGGTIGNPKELTSLQQEVEGMKAKRGRLEDKALQIMEQVEQSEASITTISSELEKLETEWHGQQQQLSSDMEQLEVILSNLKRKRQLLSAEIESRTIEFYHELRKQKGAAVAKVEQGLCGSCRISLSSAKLQWVRGNSLVQCSNCGRILFLA